MKNSGIDWIGMIPNDWCVEKGKHVFAQRNTKGNETPVLLAATQKSGMIPQSLLEGVVQVKLDTDLQTFKTVHVGDFVISLRSFQGGFEMSDYEGVCSPAYQVFYSTQDIFHKYYKYLFKSYGFISKMNSLVVGIREGKNIQYKDFAESMLPIPPFPTQQRIANFLDRKCAEIDEFAALQETMIAELKRYKQSVITEAVTKGLDPNVPMKDSGVEWVGKIPSHWDSRRIKNIGHSLNGLTYSPADMVSEKEGILVLRSSNIQGGKLTFDDNVYVSTLIPPSLMVKKGDLIICSRNGSAALVGKCALVEDDNLKATYGAFMMRFQSVFYGRYIYYLLSSAISQYKQLFFTTTINQLTVGTFGGLRMPFTKSDTEQRAIADYLDKKCAEIDELIAIKQQKIEALKEYKKSVIFECVTGKKEIEK